MGKQVTELLQVSCWKHAVLSPPFSFLSLLQLVFSGWHHRIAHHQARSFQPPQGTRMSVSVKSHKNLYGCSTVIASISAAVCGLIHKKCLLRKLPLQNNLCYCFCSGEVFCSTDEPATETKAIKLNRKLKHEKMSLLICLVNSEKLAAHFSSQWA